MKIKQEQPLQFLIPNKVNYPKKDYVYVWNKGITINYNCSCSFSFIYIHGKCKVVGRVLTRIGVKNWNWYSWKCLKGDELGGWNSVRKSNLAEDLVSVWTEVEMRTVRTCHTVTFPLFRLWCNTTRRNSGHLTPPEIN